MIFAKALLYREVSIEQDGLVRQRKTGSKPCDAVPMITEAVCRDGSCLEKSIFISTRHTQDSNQEEDKISYPISGMNYGRVYLPSFVIEIKITNYNGV